MRCCNFRINRESLLSQRGSAPKGTPVLHTMRCTQRPIESNKMLSRRRILISLIVLTAVLAFVVFIWERTGESSARTNDVADGRGVDVATQYSFVKVRHNSNKDTRQAGKRKQSVENQRRSDLLKQYDGMEQNQKQSGKLPKLAVVYKAEHDDHNVAHVRSDPSLTKQMHSRNLLQRADTVNPVHKQVGHGVILTTRNPMRRPSVSNTTQVKYSQRTLKCDKKSSSLISDANYDIRKFVSEMKYRPTKNRTGYVLALAFREQQTKASVNIFSLQCWAKTLYVYIVEPYVIDSRLVFPMEPATMQSEALRFRDLFDITIWQRVTAQHGFAPLAGWESFLADAPRELIVVRFKYVRQSIIESYKEKGQKAYHLAMNNEYKYGCTKTAEFSAKLDHLVSMHNFKVVREVCFNFENGDELTLSQFNRHIYRETAPRHATVLMEEWRGLAVNTNGKRIVVYDACWTETQVDSGRYSWPSQHIICDAQAYKKRYLKTSGYIALMVRTEKFLTFGESKDHNFQNIGRCLNKTIRAWNRLKQKTGLKLTFLSIDVGKYGSTSLTEKHSHKKYLPYLHLYKNFFKQVYGPSSTIESWESSFESITNIRDTGYIGSLQKTLVSQAQCIVFSGGGSFQKHAKYMHETITPSSKEPCIQVVEECSKM